MSSIREDYSRDEDDRPEREAGRVSLVRDAVIPLVKQSLDAFDCFNIPESKCFNTLLYRYKFWRDTAERGMTGAGVGGQTGHLLRIDRHKISAAILLAVLDARPLQLKPGQSIKRKGEALANHNLAFRSAIRILKFYAIHEAVDHNDSEKLKLWTLDFCLPTTRDGLDYREHAALALFHAQQNNLLNLPIVANWLFMLEQYHCASAKLKARHSAVPLG